jgi:hypothetical protein
MYQKFYPQTLTDSNLALQFAEKASALGVNLSAAQVQGYFMFFKHSPQGAIENVERLAKSSKK